MKYIYFRLRNSSLFKDSFWALLGSALGKGLALIAGIAVARFLGNEVYGEYGMIRNNLTMIAVFSSLGLGYTSTKFIAESKDKDHEKVNIVHKIVSNITLVTSLLIMLVVLIFASPISLWLEADGLDKLLRLSSVAIVFNAINSTQIGELSGFNAYKKIAKNNTWTGIITFITSIVLTYYYNIVGAVIALIISLLFNCTLNHLTLKQYLKKTTLKYHIDSLLQYKEIIRFSLPVALQESTYSITSWIGTVIMIKYAGYGELGIYAVATQWLAVMLFVPGSLRNVALSHLSETNDCIEANKHILKQMSFVNFMATFVPFLIICIFSSWICRWYGTSYEGLQFVLNICIFSSIINALLNALTQNLVALNQNWFLFCSRFVKDILALITCVIIIQNGCRGALAFALSNLLFSTLYLIILVLKQRYLYQQWMLNSKNKIGTHD